MSQDNIFREVDEELRSDRMRQLWRTYGPYIIGAAIAVVLVVAGNELWKWWQTSNAARSSDQFYEAVELADGGDLAAASAALDALIAGGSGSYPTLARFKQAGLLAKEGRLDEALAAYDTLSTTESNTRLRELALVLAANILVDTGSLADVTDRVGGLTTDDNPLRNIAREAIGLAQYKAGDLSAASASFQAVADDPNSSSEMLQRMQVYMAQLVAEGVVADEPAEAAASDDAAADAPVDDATAGEEVVEAPAAEGDAAPE